MIDCDVHNDWSSAHVLLPYMDATFRDYLERGELPGGRGSFLHAHRPWLHPEDFRRHDIRPTTDDEHYSLMREHLLDRYHPDVVILTGEEAIEVSTLANPHYATALARAYNDWMVEAWLARDQRLAGSLVIAPQDPKGAAAEIRLAPIILPGFVTPLGATQTPLPTATLGATAQGSVTPAPLTLVSLHH